MSKESTRKPSPIIAGGLLLIIAYFTINVGQTLYQSQSNNRRLQDLQHQVDQLHQQQQQLQQQAQAKQTTQFIESEARNQLNLSKPNETIVIFPETAGVSDQASTPQSSSGSAVASLGALAAWQRLFW